MHTKNQHIVGAARWRVLIHCGVLAAMLSIMPAAAQQATGAAAPRPESDGVATSKRTITLRDGRRLSYTARAGYLPLVNDATREVTAHVYFVAYAAETARGAKPRPLTFVFPGGPGSTSTMSDAGPRRVVVKDGVATVVDNPDTFLATTDLILIDPVGTGYSRMTKPEYTPLFYGVKADRDSLVEVMRLYLQRYDPFESPIFLMGGSYGSIRSVLVADAAMNRGIPIRGIMITAEGVSLSVNGTDLHYSILMPGFTIVAHAHKKLPADLQSDRDKAVAAAKKWTTETYVPALARGNALSTEERHRIALEMARFSGLKPEVIEAHNLRLGLEEFTNELLRDEGKSVGFYDTRITGPAQNGPYDARQDPSLMARGAAYPSLRERYLLNRELGVVSDNYYAGPFGGGWPVREGFEDWMAVKWGMSLEQEPVGIGMDAMLPTFLRIVDSGVRVLMGQGYYDWACPPFGVDYVASRVSPEHKDYVTVIHYETGHGVPSEKFAPDAAAFIDRVLREPAPKPPTPIVE
jgi:carboxypeptidase C (cathepsin A)